MLKMMQIKSSGNTAKTDECPYEYSTAPEGYSWHAIEYTLSISPEDLYVDIKLVGLDGEKLKYRGVALRP